MLRNQFRKQTKNTAKNLHLNYQALVVSESNLKNSEDNWEQIIHAKGLGQFCI